MITRGTPPFMETSISLVKFLCFLMKSSSNHRLLAVIFHKKNVDPWRCHSRIGYVASHDIPFNLHEMPGLMPPKFAGFDPRLWPGLSVRDSVKQPRGMVIPFAIRKNMALWLQAFHIANPFTGPCHHFWCFPVRGTSSSRNGSVEFPDLTQRTVRWWHRLQQQEGRCFEGCDDGRVAWKKTGKKWWLPPWMDGFC